MTLNFSEILISIVVGWGLGMASTWLILAKPWLDRRLLAKKPVMTQVQQSSTATPALSPVGSAAPAKVV